MIKSSLSLSLELLASIPREYFKRVSLSFSAINYGVHMTKIDYNLFNDLRF